MAHVSIGKLSTSTQRSSEPRGVGGPLGGTRSQPSPECTYKMEPDRKFMSHRAGNIIEDVLETELREAKYESERSQSLCRHLADTIKSRVKELDTDRYKIIAMVTIGSLDHTTSSLASQCVWNEKYDTYSEFTFKNGSLYALGVVYGIYQE